MVRSLCNIPEPGISEPESLDYDINSETKAEHAEILIASGCGGSPVCVNHANLRTRDPHQPIKPCTCTRRMTMMGGRERNVPLSVPLSWVPLASGRNIAGTGTGQAFASGKWGFWPRNRPNLIGKHLHLCSLLLSLKREQVTQLEASQLIEPCNTGSGSVTRPTDKAGIFRAPPVQYMEFCAGRDLHPSSSLPRAAKTRDCSQHEQTVPTSYIMEYSLVSNTIAMFPSDVAVWH